MATTFRLTPVVEVRIRGENRDFPNLPIDDGTVLRFLEFKTAAAIYEAVRGGICGPGMYTGYFHPHDAARIDEWLRANGCVPEES
jgi:hypothetical protein